MIRRKISKAISKKNVKYKETIINKNFIEKNGDQKSG